MQAKLFIPALTEAQDYGKRLTDLYFKFGFTPKFKIQDEDLRAHIKIGKIPFTLRMLGIPSGEIFLLPTNIPHMIGFGQEKTNVCYKNMHNLNLEEMLTIPNIVSDPDMIFRSNTHPNSSIILCKELENRGCPIILAMKISLQDNLNSAGIIVSGYEKDNSPIRFFSNLYRYGYCIYDSEESEFFEKIKTGAGARDRSVGPIPTGAVACTAPCDKALTTDGISPSVTITVLTKQDIVKKYQENSKEVIAIINENNYLALQVNRNLTELGFHTVIPNSLSKSEILSLLKTSTAIACDKDMISEFEFLKAKCPNITKIGQAIDYMPSSIFTNKLMPLQEYVQSLPKELLKETEPTYSFTTALHYYFVNANFKNRAVEKTSPLFLGGGFSLCSSFIK